MTVSAMTATTTTAAATAAGTAHATQRRASNTARIVGSGAAGMVELCLFHPVDTIAKRLMTNTDRPILERSLSASLRNLNDVIFRADVLRASSNATATATTTTTTTTNPLSRMPLSTRLLHLFPGLGFAAVYKVSQRVYKFAGQPWVADVLQRGHFATWCREQYGHRHGNTLVQATAGACVGVGEIVLIPLDALKIKAQTNPAALDHMRATSLSSSSSPSSTIVDAARTLRSLYAGSTFTAFRNATGSFVLFGVASFWYESVFGLLDYKKATFAQTLEASSAAAVCSLVVSAPFDVVKTRIQRESLGSTVRGRDVLANLWAREGPRALFKGLVPKLVAVSPKLILSFTLAQFFIARIDEHLRRRDYDQPDRA